MLYAAKYGYVDACDQYRKKAKSEKPKTVFSHKRRQLLREAMMVHFLPVAVNFTLLGLYVRRVSWTPPWPTTNVLNALQFAAKFHETLMVASLVHVLLHDIRHRLLCTGHRGLPLGIITSPFRLLDITYLWSREFLASVRILGGFRFAETITVVIHVFLFALAAVLGPASAIIMMPRLGEWDIAQTVTKAPFYNLHDRRSIYQVYMGADLSEIFPKAITASFIPEACDYSNLSLPQTNTCPRLGLTDILQGLLLLETGDDVSNLPSSDEWWSVDEYNITVQSHHQALPTRSITFETFAFLHFLAKKNVESVVDVTTSIDAIFFLTQCMVNHYLDSWLTVFEDAGSTYQAVYSFMDGKEWAAQFISNAGDVSSPWKQPYVSSYCSETGVGSTVSNFLTFTFADFAQQNGTKPYIVTLDTKLLSTDLGDKDIGFIDTLNLNIMPSYTPSAALAFTSQSHTTLCLVKAYWIESTLYGSLFNDFYNSMGVLTWDWQAAEIGPLLCSDCRFHDETVSSWFNQANNTELIHLEVEWLKALDRGTASDSTGQNSFFDKLRRVCSGSSALADDTLNSTRNHPALKCFATGLGAGIAEGLSKMPYNIDIHALGSMEEREYGAPTLSSWTSSSSSSPILGNWTESTLSPAQIRTNSTRLDFTITQRLYGYDFNSMTITLAFVVVFLYAATILIHVCIMTFGTGWSSRSWKSLGEFFVLGLQSPTPATALNNTGGGVEVSKTWQARVSVKELEHGRRVGVVIVEPGQADSGEGSTSVVRPDWKYY